MGVLDVANEIQIRVLSAEVLIEASLRKECPP